MALESNYSLKEFRSEFRSEKQMALAIVYQTSPCYFIWGHDLASQFTLELKENLQQKVHNESNKRSHAPRQEAQGAACSGNCLLPLIQAVVKG